jgi:hypothetical protein
MNNRSKALCVLAIFSLVAAAPSVWALWIPDGVPVCTAPDAQIFPYLVSDGVGGTIVTWQDYRSGNSHIYAHRINSSGDAVWTSNGVAVSTASWSLQYPRLVADAAGGAIVTWQDNRNPTRDIYAQRVDASGNALWTANGIALCSSTGHQEVPLIATDGAGGAIVTWRDYRSGNWDVYAQRVDASGNALWTANGVALCTASETQSPHDIISDGAGGAIVTWYDYRAGNQDIYVQRVDASGSVLWTANGVPVCTASGTQYDSRLSSDGAGGAIVVWEDARSGNYDIYAQRVNASGIAQWTANGVSLCAASGDQTDPRIISDGAGGAIATWCDNRTAETDIYAQRVNASGVAQWTANGVSICAATGNQYHPVLAPDGAGGAILAWADYRSATSDIYVQRVNASGVSQWAANGAALCIAEGNQSNTQIISNGAGGAILAWADYRSGNSDIYAHRVEAAGVTFAPVIQSVRDVPGDQGGWVRISMVRSGAEGADPPVFLYNVWQRIDGGTMAAGAACESLAEAAGVNAVSSRLELGASAISSWPLVSADGRVFVRSRDLAAAGSFPPGTWELLGSFAACRLDTYIYRASTLADSSASGTPYSVYVVSAHATPSLWYVSRPDSGYSVDNIPPGPPEGLSGRQSYAPAGLALTWNVNQENDLSHYAVYRSPSEAETGDLIATPTAPECFDGGWHWSAGYFYWVSAVDVHGNESDLALLRPDDVSGGETPRVPEASYLAQNYPNPFNPMTRLEYGLAAPARVSLRIYDASGRLVRALVEADRAAGRHAELWDGRDASGRAVASGIYFYRIEAGAFSETRKSVLAR